MSKQCSKCGQIKPLAEFHNSIASPDGLQSACKPCKLERNSRWRKSNPDVVRQSKRKYASTHREQIEANRKKYMADRQLEAAEYRRRWNLASRYGMTVEQFHELLDSQGGCCAVCAKPLPSDRRMSVDHCHDTGVVRGILCIRCNVAIGALGDSIEGLERAIAYLRNQPGRHLRQSGCKPPSV